jgi:hypothetical protein
MFAVNLPNNDHIYVWLFLDNLMELVGRCVQIMEREPMLCQPQKLCCVCYTQAVLGFRVCVDSDVSATESCVFKTQSFFKLEVYYRMKNMLYCAVNKG